MSLRPPSRYSPSAVGGSSVDTGGINPIDHEIAAEKAASLGRAGERVAMALRQLRENGENAQQRPALVRQAVDAVYAYFIQRELCGLRRHHDAIADYGIPREILARLGAS